MSEAEKEIDVRQNLEDIQKEDAEKAEETVAEPEYSESEEEAMSEGWNPEGTDKDGKSLSADEYMARKPLFNKIKNQGAEIRQMQSDLKAVQGDTKKMAQNFLKEKEGLLEKLESQRESLLNQDFLDEDGVNAVKDITKQIKAVGAVENQAQPERAYTNDDFDDAYLQFTKDEPWAISKPELNSVAGIHAKRYMSEHPDANPVDMYNFAANKIKEEYPNEFKEESKPSKVSTTTRRGVSTNSKRAVTLADIPLEEQKLYQTMADSSGKTIDEYLKGYKLEDFK